MRYVIHLAVCLATCITVPAHTQAEVTATAPQDQLLSFPEYSPGECRPIQNYRGGEEDSTDAVIGSNRSSVAIISIQDRLKTGRALEIEGTLCDCSLEPIPGVRGQLKMFSKHTSPFRRKIHYMPFDDVKKILVAAEANPEGTFHKHVRPQAGGSPILTRSDGTFQASAFKDGSYFLYVDLDALELSPDHEELDLSCLRWDIRWSVGWDIH